MLPHADFATARSGEAAVDIDSEQFNENRIIQRIWNRDHTVWNPDPTEIANRLGWLDCPEAMQANVAAIEAFVEDVQSSGYTQALLLGMGGSSLAPEVFQFTFGVREGYLNLTVLDSTDPGAVVQVSEKLDPAKALFVVSTKSGGTVETLSFFKYFYNRVVDAVGPDKVGEHFVAITDPGSGLEEMAGQLNFRKIFLNDPNIGGRFSVLSYFGLVPAALIGMDLRQLLERAREMAAQCKSTNVHENPGTMLGATMGQSALERKDKLTLIASPGIAHFGLWAEQLIAESTGKDGKGILPVEDEAVSSPEVYAQDRLFVYLKLDGDCTSDGDVARLKESGHPVVELNLNDVYELGGEFFRWEFATAVASYFLKVNPFDQPNVESAKVLARKMVSEYQAKGKLPESKPMLTETGIDIYTDIDVSDLQEALSIFFAFANTGSGLTSPRSYVAIQAFVQPTSATDAALQSLRLK
ncbi:MAG: transaldolase, partial [bacterium]